MSILNIFHWSYWFTQPDVAWGGIKWFWIIGFLVLILAGIVFRFLRQSPKFVEYREVFRRFSNIGWTVGILGLIWMFFRQQYVPFLAWRFWLIIWFVIFAIWTYKVTRYLVKRLPAIKEEKTQRLEKEKYLPKPKK